IRLSKTENYVRLNIESRDKKRLERAIKEVEALIH
ncbi:hypothetical protein D6825_01870, partial [Candidatus Woesearchaeota archaeon]